MRQTEDEADRAGNAFDEAIKALSGERPRIAPPGRNGVVAFAVSGAISSPDELNSSFNTAVRLGDRGAISAAVRRPMRRRAQNNVLSRFFSTLKERSGGVPAYSMASWMSGDGCLWDTETSKVRPTNLWTR